MFLKEPWHLAQRYVFRGVIPTNYNRMTFNKHKHVILQQTFQVEVLQLFPSSPLGGAEGGPGGKEA